MTAPAIRPLPETSYTELHGPGVDAGVGAGRIVGEADGEEILLPLRGTDVRAELSGPCGSVTVTQTFANDRPVPLECVYIFPLPPEAAIAELTFVVGERRLTAELKERGAAERQYEAAREAGQRASLLTAERADVFTTRVANIQPGEEVRVELTYNQQLSFDDGGFVFRFPLVLGDRYIPGTPSDGEPGGAGIHPDTSSVPDASRITPPRLLPGVRPAHDLAISVSLDLGELPLHDLACSQHATATSFEGGRMTVRLARADELPNRDFILRWRVGGEEAAGAVWTDGDRFAAVLVPPADLPATGRVPREVVLVVDTSSSMIGRKMVAAIDASRLVLRGLQQGDALQVVEFNSRHVKLWQKPKAVVDRTVIEADTFLANLRARGGTEIMSPLKDVLKRPPASGRVRHLVLVTDGQVGNEAEIVRYVGGLDQSLRVFAVGIDTAVNEAFLKGLAAQTGGLPAFMTPSDPIAERMTRFLATVGSPVLTSPELLGVEPTDVLPTPLPDLYQGRPVIVTGTSPDGPPTAFSVTLPDGTERRLELGAPRPGGVAVSRAHGGARVAEIERRWQLHRDPEDRKALLEASLAEGVLCTLTGLVVVDPTELGDGGEGQSMLVPVMPPDGWEMYNAHDVSAFPAGGGGHLPLMHSVAACMPSAPPRPAPAKKSRGVGSAIAGLFERRAQASMDMDDFADAGVSDFDDEKAEIACEAPAQAEAVEVEEPLSAVVLRQRLNGSFAPVYGESLLAATTAALQRLLDAGNTDAVGPFRQAVAKAVAWLLTQLATLPAGDERTHATATLTRWVDLAGTTSARERLEAVARA